MEKIKKRIDYFRSGGYGGSDNVVLLRREYIRLSKEHTELSKKHTELSKRHSKLSNKHSELFQRHQEHSKQHKALTSEHKQLLEEYSKLSQELGIAVGKGPLPPPCPPDAPGPDQTDGTHDQGQTGDGIHDQGQTGDAPDVPSEGATSFHGTPATPSDPTGGVPSSWTPLPGKLPCLSGEQGGRCQRAVPFTPAEQRDIKRFGQNIEDVVRGNQRLFNELSGAQSDSPGLYQRADLIGQKASLATKDLARASRSFLGKLNKLGGRGTSKKFEQQEEDFASNLGDFTSMALKKHRQTPESFVSSLGQGGELQAEGLFAKAAPDGGALPGGVEDIKAVFEGGAGGLPEGGGLPSSAGGPLGDGSLPNFESYGERASGEGQSVIDEGAGEGDFAMKSGEDIVQDGTTGIFKMVNLRYQRSFYPQVFSKGKK